VTRNVRTYDHFCVLARTLERLGDRWSLLVVRDLLSGPKRFTDLMDRLGGITPKTLSQRLRELAAAGVVTDDREPGRREVRYRLTPAGAELAPAVDALSWWGWRHAWRPPRAGEALHGEHLLRAIVLLLDRTDDDRRPARWHVRLVDDGDYTVTCDGQGWSLATATAPAPAPAPTEPAETAETAETADGTVTVVAATAAWAAFVSAPTSRRAVEVGVDIAGPGPAVEHLHEMLQTFAGAASRQPEPVP
jgi:DNA-binding HxlR family transcriptional regulator